MTLRVRPRAGRRIGVTGLLVILVISCGPAPTPAPATGGVSVAPASLSARPPVRYRLLLSENPVSPREAFVCFGECQPSPTEQEYLDCLKACPGFEVTHGAVCGAEDGPPRTACITVRPPRVETDSTQLIVGVIGSMVAIITMSAACAPSNTPCGLSPGWMGPGGVRPGWMGPGWMGPAMSPGWPQ